MNKEYIINCFKDESILNALRRNGITIKAFCNGRHTCGKCRVKILEVLSSNGQSVQDYGCLFNDVTFEETKYLTKEELYDGIRLACLLSPTEDNVDQIRISIVDELENTAEILTETNGDRESCYNIEENRHTFAAFDLGTTTIAAKLINNGQIIHTSTRRNSQCSYGADVISRSEASILGKAKELRNSLLGDINSIICEFPINPEYIIVAGNTTIIHLLMEYPLNEMVNYPFKPYYSGWHRRNLVFADGKEVPCTILPNISAYIGGDIVSGLFYCDYSKCKDIALFIDLGTNGEMAIGNCERILTASAAAGPAFEGTRINVATDVVECMANLRKKHIIDENGLLSDSYFEEGYPYKIDTTGEIITITQKDIRDIQMAKSAIRAGITLLIRKYGISPKDISKLFLAGGMGHGLNINSAVYIGLIPEEMCDKVVPVGNSSLGGCIKYGFASDGDIAIDSILNVSTEIVLAAEADFQTMYYEYMGFN